LTVVALPIRASSEENVADGYNVLHARTGTALSRGKDAGPTPIWGYDGRSSRPTLRVKKGEELKVLLVNDLMQPTVIHWHGLRPPNTMDGVPFLTQKANAPGESFDYHFTPPDAGTFWHHTHFRSWEQLARGVCGTMVVEERDAPQVNRDLMLVVDDCRLMDNGEIQPSFGNFHDAIMPIHHAEKGRQ
jgi:FtsP/CotA-like multicopper oxidase with cupredoxin domain